jgi:hypothetical protein
MSFGDQNKRTTRPIDSEYLEELASQSARPSVEPEEHLPRGPLAASSGRMPRIDQRGSLPTSKIDPEELIGLLGKAAPSMASAPLVDTHSADDDVMTQRMGADQFQALLQTSQASGAPHARPSTLPPEPRAVSEIPATSSTLPPEQGAAPRVTRRPIDLGRPSARSTGVQVLIGLLVIALVSALVGHTIIDAVVELVSQS